MKFFLDQRGHDHNPPLHVFPEGDPFRMYNDLAYRQDHRPVAEQLEAVGHAVRATYLYSGMTDAATLLDDAALARAVDALYTDVVSKKLYLTGGLGAVGGTETFGDDYVLPNRARLDRTHGARTVLRRDVLPRQPVTADRRAAGTCLRHSVQVDPSSPSTFALALRVPGWARGEASPGNLYRFADRTPRSITLHVNGRPASIAIEKGYARIARRWKRGGVVTLELAMPVERVVADDRVLEDRGKVAIQRGPIVYAFEGIDNDGHVLDRSLPADASLTHHFDRALLGGVEIVAGGGLSAVPYYAWNNRGRGEMTVWMPITRP